MRLRRTPLLVAFSLLASAVAVSASAATAYAECAWVLWGQGAERGNLVAVAFGGWNSRDDCERERVRKEQTITTAPPLLFTCLPDTVDPRGPKGK